MIRRIFTMVGLLAVSLGSVQAADIARKKAAPESAPAFTGCKETADTALSADVFGFGAGTDVGDVGSLGAGLEYGGAFGRRGGSFSGHGLKFGVPIGVLPCFEIGPSLNIGWARGTDRFSGAVDRATVFGGQIELKYKLLGRASHGIGLAITTEPGFSWLDDKLADPSIPFSGSERSRQFSNSYKLLTDFAILPDRVFGAVGVEFAHTFTSAAPLGLNGCAPSSGSTSAWCRASNLNVRAAVAIKVADPLFIGAEVQHLRAYDGAFLNRLAGQALFVGPTFFWEPVPGKVSVSGAYAVQVAGKARGVQGSIDTTNFSQHVAKVKVGYAF